jgi:peptidoglycan/LPS O-acetylase OafA/YrhL
LLVILSHINVDKPILHNEKLSVYLFNGTFGVHVFFVISGFIITTLLLKEEARTGSISLRNFYIRRVLRILPLAFTFLLILALLNTCFRLGIPPLDFITSFFFVKNIVPGEWHTEHYWSLSVEEQYYLVFPFLLSRGLRPYLTICFFFIGLYFCNNIIAHFWPTRGVVGAVFDIVFSNSMLSIVMGSLTSILLFKAGHRILTIPWKTAQLTIVEIFAMLAAFFLWLHPKFFGLSSFLCSCLIALTLLLLVRFQYGPVYWILNTRPVAFVGKLSFSLYIWQQLFTAHQPWAHLFKYGDSVVLNLVALGTVATLSYYVVEKPFLRLKTRYKERVSGGQPQRGQPNASTT